MASWFTWQKIYVNINAGLVCFIFCIRRLFKWCWNSILFWWNTVTGSFAFTLIRPSLIGSWHFLGALRLFLLAVTQIQLLCNASKQLGVDSSAFETPVATRILWKGHKSSAADWLMLFKKRFQCSIPVTYLNAVGLWRNGRENPHILIAHRKSFAVWQMEFVLSTYLTNNECYEQFETCHNQHSSLTHSKQHGVPWARYVAILRHIWSDLL